MNSQSTGDWYIITDDSTGNSPYITMPYTNYPLPVYTTPSTTVTYMPTIPVPPIISLSNVSMDLPRRGHPIKVYMAGKLLTLGLIGSDADCVYANKKLIFKKFVEMGESLAVEYKNEIYYYKIPYSADKKSFVPELLSVVKK